MMFDWPLRNITDVAEFLNSKRVPLKGLDRGKRQGCYPYYGASGIVDYIDDYIFDGTYLLISEDGENLYSRKTPIAFKVSGKFWVNNHAHILIEKEEGILDYLEYYFSDLDLLPYITGAVQPKLNKKNLDSIRIPIPPKEERLYINRVLNSFTDNIELNRQTNQTLEQIAQAIFKSWFVDFEPTRAKITAKQNGQDPERAAMAAISGKSLEELDQLSPEQQQQLKNIAVLFPDALVDSELGKIPREWKAEQLSEYFDVKHGYAFKGEYFSDKPTENILLTPGNFRVGGGFKFNKLKYYDGPMPEDYILARNDLLVTMTDLSKQSDTLGFPALISEVGDFKFLHNQRLGKVVGKDGEFHRYFLYFLLKSHRYRGEIVGGATGTTVKHTAPKKILAFMHPFQGELEGIFNMLASSLYSKIENNLNNNKSLEMLRNSLLPKLMSGELGVPGGDSS